MRSIPQAPQRAAVQQAGGADLRILALKPAKPHRPFVVVYSGNGVRRHDSIYASCRSAAREQMRDVAPAGTQPVAYTPDEAEALGMRFDIALQLPANDMLGGGVRA